MSVADAGPTFSQHRVTSEVRIWFLVDVGFWRIKRRRGWANYKPASSHCILFVVVKPNSCRFIAWYQVWTLRLYTWYMHFTPWSPYLFIRVPFQLNCNHFSTLNSAYTLPLHLCLTIYSFTPESSESCEGKVPCPRTHHRNNFLALRAEKHDISLSILYQCLAAHGSQRLIQAPRSNICFPLL